MFIELHLIQNFAPACLNRDDTGAPKDCVFGGARRARLSSQCLKRAIRARFAGEPLLLGHRAIRTKRLRDRLAALLAAAGRPAELAALVAARAITAMGLTVKDDGKTEYLVFLGEPELEELARQALAHWDALAALTDAPPAEENGEVKKPDKKKAKKEQKAALPPEVTKAFQGVLGGGRTADLALFGRMLADMPEKNIDAACQVAHALSTHKVEMEMDFYTAVDDLKPDDTSGADMMGTVEFNSACFYRYATLNWELLLGNLGGDAELAAASIEAFLRAAVTAIPTGKQNTFAAHNPPSFILAVAREGAAPWSLANAFEQPVWTGGKGLVQESVRRLDEYWGRLSRVYGGAPLALAWVGLDEAAALPVLGTPTANLDELVATLLAALPAIGQEVGA